MLILRYRRPVDSARVEDAGDGVGGDEHGQDLEVVFRYNDDGQNPKGDVRNNEDGQDAADKVENGNDGQNPKGDIGNDSDGQEASKEREISSS